METRTNQKEKLHIIAIKGKLDISTAQQAKIEILDKMTSGDNIIIDMSDCNYISNYFYTKYSFRWKSSNK